MPYYLPTCITYIQNPHLDLHHKHAMQLDLHSNTTMQIHRKITYLALAYNAKHKCRLLAFYIIIVYCIYIYIHNWD